MIFAKQQTNPIVLSYSQINVLYLGLAVIVLQFIFFSQHFQSEKKRIEDCGGCVITIGGCDRVNGRLAVSRAIGDNGLKDVVIGEPDVVSIPLNGNEDFLLMACDGLWDFVEEDDIAVVVYESLVQNEGKNYVFSLFIFLISAFLSDKYKKLIV